MKIIGVTGSSGSGKSTLTKILEHELNAKAIYSDQVVRKMQEKETEYYKKIVETFGENILNYNQNIDRKKLAKIIFNDKEKRDKINKLTEVYIVEEIKKQIKQAKEEYVIIDAPLLIEMQLNKECDFIIAVVSNKDTQIERICKRDNIEKKEAMLRLKAQKEDEFYKRYANYIIENNGGEYDKFMGRIKELLHKL